MKTSWQKRTRKESEWIACLHSGHLLSQQQRNIFFLPHHAFVSQEQSYSLGSGGQMTQAKPISIIHPPGDMQLKRSIWPTIAS